MNTAEMLLRRSRVEQITTVEMTAGELVEFM